MARSRRQRMPKDYDASDPAHVGKAEDAEADREEDLTFVMGNWRGRRLMYDVIYDTCHVDRRSHVPGDNGSSAFNDGARCVGTAIAEKLRASHFDKYLLMLRENHGDDD